jgi:gliding motility-associated-like protein
MKTFSLLIAIFLFSKAYSQNSYTNQNDCFGLLNILGSQDLLFVIYNKWGQKVFETDNSTICWDGKYKGSPAEQGSYVYYIKTKISCGDFIKKGSVLLLR